MSTEAAEETAEETKEPCAECGASVEGLECVAKRFEKQAAVAKESFDKLTARKTRFDTARTEYQNARDTVASDVTTTRQKLGNVRREKQDPSGLLKDIECKLDDKSESCVKKALYRVKGDLKDCSPPPGCCTGLCDFAGVDLDESLDDLSARIIRYRAAVSVSETCFDTVIAEITELAGRVTTLKGEVDAIEAAVKANLKDTDWARLYARALIARWKLDDAQLWKGYTVNSFVDCLCQALECAADGWEKIVELEGSKAERECKDAAKKAACDKKRTDMLGEVMKEYEKRCLPATKPGNGDDTDDDPDCGCGKHHGSSQSSAE